MRYSSKALVVYLVAMGITLLVHELTEVQIITLHISLMGLFMYGSSTLVHYLTLKATQQNPRRFPAYFMAITGLKMLVYVIAIGIYVFIMKEAAIPVVIAFLILYLIYTVLEVSSALIELKKGG